MSITNQSPDSQRPASSTPETASDIKTNSTVSEKWILAATILGSSMAFIDGSVVGVALPTMQKDLGATFAEAQWVVESYSLFLSALILVGGSLGDLFGRRRIYIVGIILFTIASIACGLAPNALILIVARAVQGVGGALLVPGSLAIISAAFSGDRRGRAIGTWSGFTSITTALGPVLGGWLVDNVSWRAVFFLNIPLAVAVLAMVFTHVPESRNPELGRELDWWGAGLATLGLGGLTYGLIEAGSVGLGNPVVLVALAIGVIALGLFITVEARSRTPMIPLGVFRSRTFSGANLLTLLLYGALGGVFFFFPFNLIQVQGYSPTVAGFVFLPFILLIFALSRWAGGLIGRYGAKLPLIIGPLIVAVSFVLFTLPGIGGSYWLTYFPAIVVIGLGMAITIAPLTTAVMGAVDVNNSGIASGINNAVSRVAGLLTIAVFGIFMVTAFSGSLDSRLKTLELPEAARQSVSQQYNKLASLELPKDLNPTQQAALKQAVGEAFVDSFRLIMFIGAGLALFSAFFAFLLIDGKPGKGDGGQEVEGNSGLRTKD